jgi:TonB family protein
VGTITINGFVLLLLMFFTFTAHKDIIKPEEEMLEVMFGDGAGGAGAENPGGSVSEPAPGVPQIEPATYADPAKAQGETQDQQVMSQVDDEPDVAVADKTEKKKIEKKDDNKPQTVEQKLKNLEDLRQKEAIRQQKLADARAAQEAAERQAKIDKARGAMSAFGKGSGGGIGNGEGSGSGSGGGHGTGGDGFGNGNGDGGSGASPGNPLGHGAGGGHSWSLAGRSLSGSLNRPAYVGNQEGRIIVAITVDKKGNVIATSISNGTTISDENQREECKAAARKQKFSADAKATGNVQGTITYNFKIQ